MFRNGQNGFDSFFKSTKEWQFRDAGGGFRQRRTLAGTVFAGGVNGVGDIAGHPALEQAQRMGMEI